MTIFNVINNWNDIYDDYLGIEPEYNIKTSDYEVQIYDYDFEEDFDFSY